MHILNEGTLEVNTENSFTFSIFCAKYAFSALSLIFSLVGCSAEKPPVALPSSVISQKTPTAEPPGKLVSVSYYGGIGSKHKLSKKTANGEPFNSEELTAAHRTLPFGTKVRLKNPKTGRSVIVRINDRGPFIKGRELDISHAAARQIGMVNAGVEKVEMHVEQ